MKRLRRSAFLIALKAALVMDQMELRLAARKVAELEQVERSMRDKLREADEVSTRARSTSVISSTKRRSPMCRNALIPDLSGPTALR